MSLVLLLACTPPIDGPQEWECFAEHHGYSVARPIVCRASEADARLAAAFEACTNHDSSDLHLVDDCTIVRCEARNKACVLPGEAPVAPAGTPIKPADK